MLPLFSYLAFDKMPSGMGIKQNVEDVIVEDIHTDSLWGDKVLVHARARLTLVLED